MLPAVALSVLVAAASLTGAPAVAPASPAPPACLTLPAVVLPTLPAGNVVGATPERLATSKVPGPVANVEHVEVGVAADGSPSAVSVDQTLVLSGSGDYVVYERGPARSVEPLAETAPPTLKLGRVTWAGYVPHAETLRALLGLDPAIEATRLPLSVHVDGATEDPSGSDRVTVTLTNTTALPGEVLDVAPVAASVLAPLLDRLLAEARRADPRPSVAGDGLPVSVSCDGGRATGSESETTFAPLRVTGTLGPGTTGAGATGGSVSGVLGAVPASFAVTSFAPSLHVAPTLDPRTLEPPTGYATWAAWAATDPSPASRTAASLVLEQAAAAAARIREVEPYLAADLPGTATTDFTYALAPRPVVARALSGPTAKPLPIALAALTALLLLGTAAGLARRL